jgi:hypothetical protein
MNNLSNYYVLTLNRFINELALLSNIIEKSNQSTSDFTNSINKAVNAQRTVNEVLKPSHNNDFKKLFEDKTFEADTPFPAKKNKSNKKTKKDK